MRWQTQVSSPRGLYILRPGSTSVKRAQHRLSDRVRVDVEAHVRRGRIPRNRQRVVERVDRHNVAVRLVALRGHGPPYPGVPKSVLPNAAPGGSSFLLEVPAPVGSEVTSAGMLNTTQCHHPLPVGASGSYIVIAKVFVPLGAPVHDSWGDWF